MSDEIIDVRPSQALATVPPPSLMPVFRGREMTEAFSAYRELQRSLDAGMPDQLMNIRGKVFRKKGYWRAIATAFNLNVSCIKEEATPEGWRVVYRAETPSGRFVEGDGACEHAEKRGEMDTEHNVRSHAHTRAFNRAVSNLVGFGEVSAEEVRREAPRTPPPMAHTAPGQTNAAPPATRPPDDIDDALASLPPQAGPLISEPQRKRAFAISKAKGWTTEQLKQLVSERFGFSSSAAITKASYEAVVAAIEKGPASVEDTDTNPEADEVFP